MCSALICINIQLSKLLSVRKSFLLTHFCRTPQCYRACIISNWNTPVTSLLGVWRFHLSFKLCRVRLWLETEWFLFSTFKCKTTLFAHLLIHVLKEVVDKLNSSSKLCFYFSCLSSSTDFRRHWCTLLWALTVWNDIRKTPRYNSSRQLPSCTINVCWLVYDRDRGSLSFLATLTLCLSRSALK